MIACARAAIWELGEDVRDVIANSLVARMELLGDGGVGSTPVEWFTARRVSAAR
jgi:hypothetical protein